MKTIVVSAVNIRKGGTLTILRSCLHYLSQLAEQKEYRIVALVHKKEKVFFDGIEYIEFPWTLKSWFHRLWCEYVTMYRVSLELSPVFLWLSLHDTTPRVKAARRAVFCQTSFPFFKWKMQDFRFDYKIPLFALFIRYAYRINIHKNRYLIVQQEWLRKEFSRMFHIDTKKIIVVRPEIRNEESNHRLRRGKCRTFLYPATPDCHKNFELLCRAARLLEQEEGEDCFQLLLTVNGTENGYARWLYKKWGKVSSIRFIGFLCKEDLLTAYEKADCLVFPSRIETWGLPISEYMPYHKPMLLADLPYARETAEGSAYTAFFPPEDPEALKEQMKRLLRGDTSMLSHIPRNEIITPFTLLWNPLFEMLLKNGNSEPAPKTSKK